MLYTVITHGARGAQADMCAAVSERHDQTADNLQESHYGTVQ